MTPLRIGIDSRAAAEVPAGKGRYVRELLRALARRDDQHEYVLYARRRWEEPLDERFRWRLFGLPEAVWHPWAALAANGHADVFLASTSYVTPLFLRIPTALVVHDLVAFRAEAAANSRAARIERATLRPAVRRARAVVCDSHATRRDLVELFPGAEAKSTVVQLGVSADFGGSLDEAELERIRSRYELDRPFALCVGTLEPRKNLVRVLDAFSRLPDRLREGHLLALAGPRGWDDAEILAQAERLGDHVRLLGHVPDEDLAALYRLCTVFCFPSLYEGFGLPLLEALTAGAAAIASNVSSLPEVGGDAVLYVDPTSVEEIAAALEQLLDSPELRATLSERAREQAARFSPDRMADELLAVLTSLA